MRQCHNTTIHEDEYAFSIEAVDWCRSGGDYWLYINCIVLQRWRDISLLLVSEEEDHLSSSCDSESLKIPAAQSLC